MTNVGVETIATSARGKEVERDQQFPINQEAWV